VAWGFGILESSIEPYYGNGYGALEMRGRLYGDRLFYPSKAAYKEVGLRGMYLGQMVLAYGKI
jgi:hypothetical protein